MDAETIGRAADWLCRARLEGVAVSGLPAELRPGQEAEATRCRRPSMRG